MKTNVIIESCQSRSLAMDDLSVIIKQRTKEKIFFQNLLKSLKHNTYKNFKPF